MTNQQVEQGASSIGRQLRAAREQQGLSCKDIGQQLRLPINIIEALEDDRTIDIAPVYLKGYLSAYAKLLRLDERSLCGDLESPQNLPTLQPALPSGMGFSWLEHTGKMAGYLVVTAFVVAPLVWWFTQGAVRLSFDESLVSTEQNQSLSTQGQPVIDGDVLPDNSSPASSNNGNAPVQASAAPFIALRSGNTTPANQLDQPVENGADDVILVDTETSSPQQATIRESEGDSTDLEPLVNVIEFETTDHLRLQMLDDSWVEITDADGERLEYDLLSADRVKTYTGKAPFRLLFGRASAVELYLNDEYVDMSPYTRGNVANTTLASNRPIDAENIN